MRLRRTSNFFLEKAEQKRLVCHKAIITMKCNLQEIYNIFNNI